MARCSRTSAALISRAPRPASWRACANDMKRWAALTVLLYVLALCVLSGPVLGIAFNKLWTPNRSIPFADALKLYREWGYWLWLGLMGLGQALLLLLPVTIAERRP